MGSVYFLYGVFGLPTSNICHGRSGTVALLSTPEAWSPPSLCSSSTWSSCSGSCYLSGWYCTINSTLMRADRCWRHTAPSLAIFSKALDVETRDEPPA